MKKDTKNNKSPILFISYFQGVKGCCPAEWADDKIDAMNKLDREVILISSIISKKYDSQGVKHYRVPSLSWTDLKTEYYQLKADKQKIPYVKLLVALPFVFTVGIFLDILQKMLTSGLGGSKLSWVLSSLFVSTPLKLFYRCKTTFTTGGPVSAHITGLLVKILLRGRLICELQDPLCGEEIGRTPNSARMLGLLEKYIVKISDKVVFVTKQAAAESQNRYPSHMEKIVAIYPGSKKFKLEPRHRDNGDKIELIHLGTLYSSRNLYSLIQAIDELIEEAKIDKNLIKITNLGDIYGEMKEHHLSRNYIEQLPILPREEAVAFAATKDISLLVQHNDERSQATIPYKTYDYINIKNPILGLTNSLELSSLLRDNGHVSADIENVKEIKAIIISLANGYEYSFKESKNVSIDIITQTDEMLR
ncbi:hypothetical protein [Vibrio tetraodonis]|uniref:hypothetical protein n=1 Tax=Vibrio tetraodonis TaxID=2231647 RepID=UPI000E0B3E87|nr:hypothetical protein [Vibrio tetraodonis]